MRRVSIAVICLLAVSLQVAFAQPVTWSRFTVPETGTSVDIPSVFSERMGAPPNGFGQRFETPDHRANLTVQASVNTSGEMPAAFLAKMHPPRRIQYKRITPRFFVVSSYKGDTVWYDRCNFSNRLIHCVLINYPAREERAWDDIVTRISLSLSGGR